MQPCIVTFLNLKRVVQNQLVYTYAYQVFWILGRRCSKTNAQYGKNIMVSHLNFFVFFLSCQLQKKTPFLMHSKKIFSPSYFVTALSNMYFLFNFVAFLKCLDFKNQDKVLSTAETWKSQQAPKELEVSLNQSKKWRKDFCPMHYKKLSGQKSSKFFSPFFKKLMIS